MIAGLGGYHRRDSVDGKVVNNDVAPKDRDIAMVFQNYAPLSTIATVQAQHGFRVETAYSKEDIDKRVKKQLGNPWFERNPPDLPGQRCSCRVALSCVMQFNGFVKLDAKLRVSMRAEIAKTHRSYRPTTIYATHDQT